MKVYLILAALFALTHGAAIEVIPMGDEGACGDEQPRVITESTIFMSPNYGTGNTYPPNQSCTWLLRVVDGEPEDNVEVSFLDFSMEECTGCNCDFIEAYDGADMNAQSLGRRCGGSTPPIFGSSGSEMFLHFQSDASTEFRGFRAAFSIVVLPPPGCIAGNDPTLVTEPSGTIESPGYPGLYPPSLSCRWILDVPNAVGYEIRFKSEFATENCCSCDFLEIWQGRSPVGNRRWGRWFGNMTPNVYGVAGREQYVIFRTDSSGADLGFAFDYQALF